MVGFEVSPVTSPSRTRRARSPSAAGRDGCCRARATGRAAGARGAGWWAVPAPSPDQLPRALGHVLGGEAELLQDASARRRGAEAIERDVRRAIADPALPAERDARLDRDAAP